ncbi:hypothetical protein OG209_37205 [Streptomyces sp. NBC_01383]|uniref:hypothetical protein n=1 Tax=Streptomyces sp. NBC_01383 TaxID=2903846 RepID=UPI0032544574
MKRWPIRCSTSTYAAGVSSFHSQHRRVASKRTSNGARMQYVQLRRGMEVS